MVGSVHTPNRDASKCPNVTHTGTTGWGGRIKPGSSFRSLAPCTVSRLGRERESSRVWRTMSSSAGPSLRPQTVDSPATSQRDYSSQMESDPLFCGTSAQKNTLGAPFAHPISRYWIQRSLDRSPASAPLLRL